MKTSELRKIIKEELKFVLAQGSYGTKNLRISGKLVDIDSIKLDGVDANDYPDMTDSYATSAAFKDGTELTDADLGRLNKTYAGTIFDLARQSVMEE